MTTLVSRGPSANSVIEYCTTQGTCPACATSMPLDDERSKTGTVQWEIITTPRIRTGVAVDFECPNGHRALDDAQLLKAFRARRF